MIENNHQTYNYLNKESVLNCLSDVPRAEDEFYKFMKNEVEGIQQGKTNPDFLEILQGQRLFDSLILIQKILSEGKREDKDPPKSTIFDQIKKDRFKLFITTLEKLLESHIQNEKVSIFINEQRKSFGLVSSITQLKELADILCESFRRDLVREEEMLLINYPGSFNPFPHIGHLEAVRLMERAHRSLYTQEPRILISTVSQSNEKDLNNNTFNIRLDNMHKGFIDENYVSVVGLAGDFANKQHRIEQISLLSRFDSEQRLRFLLGSDNFINKVESSLAGDSYSRFVLNRENIIFVSIRPKDNYEKLIEAEKTAQQQYSSRLIFLGPQKINLSGTQIRSMGGKRSKQFTPNTYI